jgi:hypothetical protein
MNVITRVTPTPFNESAFRGFPVQHTDPRRVITEIEEGDRCVTCILVTSGERPLGNHYHTKDEPFKGRGSGKLYLKPVAGDMEVYDLPADGWEVTVPAGIIHAFVFDGQPDANGHIAVLVSDKGWKFNEDPEKGEVNTFRVNLDLPTTA